MKQSKQRILIFLAAALVAAVLIQGCGGGGGTSLRSDVNGTVADIDGRVILDADVWIGDHHGASLASGAFRIENVPSGWQTIHARAMVNGVLWQGSTAVEVLEGEPTMNANITLTPAGDTTYIEGYVYDDVGHQIQGARVLLTTRLTADAGGPYGSIVAITDNSGYYRMEDVPLDLHAKIAASKVAFNNDEQDLNPITDRKQVDFELSPSTLDTPNRPTIEGVDAWTMPSPLVRSLSTKSQSEGNPYDAVKAFTSTKFRESLKSRKTATVSTVRSAFTGSLIEIDVYWDAWGTNASNTIAGYGIYRRVGAGNLYAIDFIRDPYTNFYGDMGGEIEPDVTYAYRVSAVNVEFLDRWNDPIAEAESPRSTEKGVTPLGSLHADMPLDGGSILGSPVFTWQAVGRAAGYSVYVYDRFPSIPLDPGVNTPAYGTAPIWTSPWAGNTSVTYAGPALQAGHTYYWLAIARDATLGAFSYSELRSFTAR